MYTVLYDGDDVYAARKYLASVNKRQLESLLENLAEAIDDDIAAENKRLLQSSKTEITTRDSPKANATSQAASIDTATPTPLDAERKPCDGPAPPNLFWWNGQRNELPPRLWSLVNYLWLIDNAAVEAAVKAVWKDEGENVADGTIRSTLSQLNTKLNEFGIGWEYRLKSGHIVKE